MADIVGVRFRRAGKVYYFDPAGIELKAGDTVIVDTARGMELGHVVIAPGQVLESAAAGPLKPVLRKANDEDLARARELEEKEKEALRVCGELVSKLNLPMKLLSAEVNLDGNRLTVYFSAEERVDFRELVRELAGRLKTRVELRQVGPRDEAKLIGGFGRCGRPLCCAAFLSEFAPVSIKMAKEQNLPLNPMKISGTCGRLLCCLTYESELYRATKERFPRVGQRVTTPMGVAFVVGINPIKDAVMVELETKANVEFSVNEVTPADEPRPQRRPGPEVKEKSPPPHGGPPAEAPSADARGEGTSASSPPL
jgi:cell fate regulator YaaT (PSP1 superfamily)